jgi:hypothetical protein
MLPLAGTHPPEGNNTLLLHELIATLAHHQNHNSAMSQELYRSFAEVKVRFRLLRLLRCGWQSLLALRLISARQELTQPSLFLPRSLSLSPALPDAGDNGSPCLLGRFNT